MKFNFYPWTLDVDVEATKELYAQNDFAEDRTVNERFVNSFTKEQKAFFDSVGVDPMRVRAEEKVHDIPDEGEVQGGKVYVRTFDFLMCGKFIALPDFYRKLYSDEEVFGDTLPEALETTQTDEDKMPIYELGEFGVIFKHPYFRDPQKFSDWDCGYIMGSILTMKDLQ